MNKKILLGLGSALVVVAGVAGLAAFEAHVINVTAKIENALAVDLDHIAYGTVFPQEALDEYIDVVMSQSFQDETRADDIDYVIKQKPKCWSKKDNAYGRVTEIGDQGEEYICVQSNTADDYTMLPILCPFLSKHEMTKDMPTGGADNDTGINAFHGPATNWTPADTEATKVTGRLAKSELDFADEWKIDFRVPCFEGYCAQDWADFVYNNNPDANADDYMLPYNLEHAEFGCDLWIEVTGISRVD